MTDEEINQKHTYCMHTLKESTGHRKVKRQIKGKRLLEIVLQLKKNFDEHLLPRKIIRSYRGNGSVFGCGIARGQIRYLKFSV